MKRITAWIFIFVLILTMFMGTALAAPAYEGNVGPYAVMLLDATTGDVLYEKNADETIEPASTTKIMTLLLALENADMDSEVTISSNAAGQGGSLLHVSAGEKIKMKDLLNGMMLASGNDAAVAVAEAVGGSESGFADMMNAKASELGMTKTHFVVPHGMHVDNHYSTAHDMSLLTVYAMQNEDFAKIVGQASYTMPADNKHSSTWEVKNTNKLLLSDSDNKYYYKYATGIKTGSTPAAGDCLVSSASKDGMNLICLVYKDEYNGSERWPLSKSLFEYGFENYRTVSLESIIDKAESVSVQVQNAADGDGTLELKVVRGGKDYVTLGTDITDAVESGKLQSKVELSSGDTLSAPVNEGDEVGTVTYTTEAGDTVCQAKLVASRSVASASEPTVQPTQQPGTTGTEKPLTPTQDDGIGLLGWILIAVGVVLAVILALLVITLMRRKRRYARRRAARRKGR